MPAFFRALRHRSAALEPPLRQAADRSERHYSPFASTGPRPGIGLHRVVIVGGGAGGLELAARLGDQLGRKGKAEIVLVDPAMTHLWKPLLHEVAAGTLGPEENALDYLQQARQHRFRFHLGAMTGLERSRKEVWLDPLVDDEGNEVAPRRSLWYDTLVLAVGCVDNDFGTPGVRQHAFSLNGVADAERFHRRLLALCARAEFQGPAPVRVVIVGGGATGVELAAEISESVREIASYGARMSQLPQPIRITLVESGPRLLGPLPEAVADKIRIELEGRGVEIRVRQRVVEVRPDRVVLGGPEGRQEELPTDATAWAAGVRAPDFLAGLDGLESNKTNQLIVRPTLQTSRDDDIFALGDCASCVLEPGKPPVPPMAQAAHQEAKLLAASITGRLRGEPPLEFAFHYRGVLVSLGQHDAVGVFSAMIRSLKIQRLMIEGLFARFSYWILYRRHLATLLGLGRTFLLTLGGWLTGRSHTRIKLH